MNRNPTTNMNLLHTTQNMLKKPNQRLIPKRNGMRVIMRQRDSRGRHQLSIPQAQLHQQLMVAQIQQQPCQQLPSEGQLQAQLQSHRHSVLTNMKHWKNLR